MSFCLSCVLSLGVPDEGWIAETLDNCISLCVSIRLYYRFAFCVHLVLARCGSSLEFIEYYVYKPAEKK